MMVGVPRIRAERALILAAGIGRRLGTGMEHKPKALLRFGGASLLGRHVAILRENGIADITVVTGYREDDIRAELDTIGGGVATVTNPDFRSGSVVSLDAGRAMMESGAPVVLMDADVFYDTRLMARLLDSPVADCLLLDREIEPGDEPVKICVAGGTIVDFRKKPEFAHEWHGESVGFFRFSPATAAALAARAADYVASGRGGMEYEEPIRDMILAGSGEFGFEDISGLPWTEIDFPEDVAKAHALSGAMLGLAA
jgi:choline kinase